MFAIGFGYAFQDFDCGSQFQDFNVDSFPFEGHTKNMVDTLASVPVYFKVFLKKLAPDPRYLSMDTANLHRISILVC